MADIEQKPWKRLRDSGDNPQRRPGPIHLNRAAANRAYQGIPTLFGLPLALTVEDLVAGDVDVAVVGASVDMSPGHRGAAYGPRAIRSMGITPSQTPQRIQNPDTRVKPFEVLKAVDYGDVPIDPLDLRSSLQSVREMVREIAAAGVKPLVLGGDHSLMLPDAAALQDVYGQGKVGVVHFDKHADCATDSGGHPISNGTMIRRLFEDEGFPGENFVQIGLYSWGMPDDDLLAWMRAKGLRSHYMAEIERLGFERVIDQAINEALDGPEFLFLSVDIDVLDPAYAPGCGSPEPGGLTPREILPAVRRVCHEAPIVGMELVEVAPYLDPSGITVDMARHVILEMCSGLAQRKAGITEKNYVHPIMAGLA